MIHVKNLTRQYGDFTAVKSISFDIPKGQIVGLLGHNGAGKTTTIKILTGYLEPTAGEVTIDGLDILESRLEIQKKIGYLSESSPLYPDMGVWEYLEYVANLRGIPSQDQFSAIKKALKATDLIEKAKVSIDTLSKGYRQRVGVAQAILHDPEILILDEPTNGLDPTQILAMRTLIKNLAKTATVIISTHIMQEVEAICDRVLIILNGQLAVDSSLSNLQNVKNITFSVDQPFQNIKDALSQIESAKTLELLGRTDNISQCRLLLEEDHPLLAPKIARTIVEKGWNLYHMQKEHRNLETVFRDVNRPLGGPAHV
jgi:ABC-2 type transport system ATP-binding protein